MRKRLRLVLDGKVEESQQSSLIKLRRVVVEHGYKGPDGVGELAPTLVGCLGKTPNIASRLELGLGVGGLKEAESSGGGGRIRPKGGCLSGQFREASWRRVVHSRRQQLLSV